MKHLLLLLLVAAPLTAAEPEVDRKRLKPGLIAGYTQYPERPTTTTTYRLEPTVALYLPQGEGATTRGTTANANWRGYIQIVTAGKYRFTGLVQGGAADVVLIRGEAITRGLDGSHEAYKRADLGTTAVEAAGPEVLLEPGVYRFTARYTGRSQNPAARRFELHWEGPGFRREPIPNFFFGHLPEQRADTVDQHLQGTHGRYLFEELGCKNCHASKADSFVERTGPDLSDVGRRVFPGWLDAWLADPAKLRPHTTMPKLFADDERGKAERYAVGQYLTSLGGPIREPKVPTISNEWSKSLTNGAKLFTTTGCAACHGKQLPATAKKSEDDEDDKPVKFEPGSSLFGYGTATGPQALYSLGGLGSKTTPEQLQRYLLDPLKLNPHGRMPNMQLTNDEARDLARHLYRTTDDKVERDAPKEPTMKPADFDAKSWKELGQRLVTSKGCANCHAVAPGGQKMAARETVSLDYKTGDKRNRGDFGCLAAKPNVEKTPVYSLDAEQSKSLKAFVGYGLMAGAPSSIELARSAMKRFNCLNCHVRDGEGGIGTELADQMKKLENAENADDVAPPRLTGVGHKAKTGWLNAVLVNGARARPWMSLRMPQYGAANVGHLPVALAHLEATVPDDATKPVTYAAASLEAGRKLNGSEGLGCIKCHDISGHVGGGTRGPDLARTAERLRYDWYERWMHNPQRLAPGTKMPQNFNNGKSAFTNLLNGDAAPQIEAIWAYLSLGPGLPLPVGMEPPKGLILKGAERPEILRTFMPDGAGTKAIAVGFAGSSFVFDAAACRVAYAWEGNFIDASPVWNNRGGAPAKLLGPKFLAPPSGQPWGVTGSRTPPDFAKRAKDPAFGAPLPNEQIYQGPRHTRFEGYTLDAAGVPTFRYRVSDPDEKGELAIRESIAPAKGSVATGLTRSFAIDMPATRTAWLLAGETAGVPRAFGPNGTVLELNLKGDAPEVPAVGAKIVLPDGGRATVLVLASAPSGTVWRFVPRTGGGWNAVLRLPEPKDAVKAEVAFTAWSAPKDDDAIIGAIGK
jgi:mono/diheme cytochrome c family protein